MKELGIPTAVHYPSTMHVQPAFARLGLKEGAFPAAESAARRVISLPMHPYLADDQQRRVVTALKTAVMV
jgi:UDP-2-acetamido-2-deoxy-ribo-hexuluronate aminotransferase